MRHHALDAVRGLAALAVANYHFLYHSGTVVQSMGTFTVYLFFTLSALSLLMVYGGKFSASISLDDARRFYRARAARILPLLALVSLVVTIRDPSLGVKSLLTGTGALALAPPGFASSVMGAWSLGIELAFYAVFPVLALLLASVRTLVIITLCMIGLQHAYLWLVGPMEWELYTMPLTFAPFFLIGFVIYRLGGARSRLMLAPMLLSFACVAGYSLLFPSQLFADPVSYLVLTGLVSVIIFCAWRTELPALLVPVGAFLGEISYSLYLTHAFYLEAAQRVSSALDLPLWQTWALFMVSSLSGAWLCFRCFELKLRDRLNSARSGRQAPVRL